MTTVALLADPPRPGLVLTDLVASSPLSREGAADLHAAMVVDAVTAIENSGGDLLVNYRPDEALPAEHRRGDGSAAAELRELVAGALDADPGDSDGVRFERQVGETFAGRVGNTVTHLLETEGVDSVGVVEPTAALLTRPLIDGAAMKLRRSEVVLGPAPGGRVHYAAFTDTIDFEGAYAAPAIETLTDRAREARHDVDFLEMLPVVGTGEDLVTVLSVLGARRRAGRAVPEHTIACLDDLGVGVVADGDTPELVGDGGA
jgi:glycosyltransferase A (GT-A) superfamily protein (DUF2064 family)